MNESYPHSLVNQEEQEALEDPGVFSIRTPRSPILSRAPGVEFQAEEEDEIPKSRWLDPFKLRRIGVTIAICGAVLAGTGLTLMARPSQCTQLTSIGGEKRVAWEGGRAGPLERKLQVVDPGHAQIIVANAAQTATEIADQTAQLTKALAAEAAPRVSPQKIKKRNRARCILQTLAVSESIAKIVTNLLAAKAVCAPDRVFKYIPGKFGKALVKLRKIVCSVNIELVISGFLAVASTLSEAAISCSIAANASSSLNLNQQFDAACASATYQMTNSLVSLAASFSIAIPGCEIVAKGLEKTITQSLSALGENSVANFGSAQIDPSQVKAVAAKLAKNLPDGLSGTTLFGRRLFLGGGKGAILTQCVVDVLQALTQLSLIGIAIDTLANAACDNPSVGLVTSMALPKFLRKRIENTRRATCGGGISQILAQLGLSTVFLSFTSFHCTNKADIKAICGAGVAGMTGALAGIAASGAGVYVSCKEGQRADQTEKLTEKFITDFLNQEATDILHESCPDLSLDCFVEFTTFFSNCPVGSSTPGPVTDSCPVPPSPHVCPGIEQCVDTFNNNYRPAAMSSGDVWFPQDDTQFGRLVARANPCFQYLTCFLDTPRRLEEADAHAHSDALRTLLLHKVSGPDPAQWRTLIHEGPGSVRMHIPPEAVQLSERLWNRTNRTSLTSATAVPISEWALRADALGGKLLAEAAGKLHKLQASSDFCPASDAPLLDDGT